MWKSLGLGNMTGRSPSWIRLELSRTGEVAARMERMGEDWLVANWEKATTEAKPSLLGGREVTPDRETERVLVLQVG